MNYEIIDTFNDAPKIKYREDDCVAKPYKQNYLDGIERIIRERQKAAEAVRDEYCAKIFEESDRYRKELAQMLGWPFTDPRPESAPNVISEKLADEEGYSIYRMQVEILDGLYMTGLLFRKDGEGKKPMVIVQHGGAGTPEVMSGIYEEINNYNNMLQRVIANDVHAFAPQTLLWDRERYGIKFDRREIDGRLKRVGSSIAALEVYGIMRIVDYFEKQDYVSDFGMVGLSYGGFFTLFVAALDTRISSSVCSSFFNTRDKYGWSDFVWDRSAEKFDDAEIACLIYPRKLSIQNGNLDKCFDYTGAISSFEKLKVLCKEVGTDWVDFNVFYGRHEFWKNDEPIQRLVNDLKNA